ncbi:GtrA family protein [Altererythrobacter xixiisoli]|uniref:GtrA family protein n=1 Tax=Croceibacterium xixiisoli TaxID=1476466 RepID=A0A6I4TQH5_9SPHN|nr:GtrA family protein [Croceibacterium xixiisoli]MXO97589.1 GtrA family protein [Croceibacterium xixiisoli]
MIALARRLLADTFLRYVAASGVALAADLSAFFALVFGGMPAGAASALAYSFGIIVHWLIASRAVFIGDVAERGRARTRQKALFVLSAFAGLALTTGIVSAGAAVEANLLLTKLVAVATSFAANWMIRRRLVFRLAPATA